MEQLRRQSAHSKTLRRVFGQRTLFLIQKVEEKKAAFKGFLQNFRGKKGSFRLRKERNKKKIKNKKKKVKDDILKNIINLFKQEKESKPKTKKEVKGDVFLDIKLVYKLR